MLMMKMKVTNREKEFRNKEKKSPVHCGRGSDVDSEKNYLLGFSACLIRSATSCR